MSTTSSRRRTGLSTRTRRPRSENKRPLAVLGSGMAVLGLLAAFAIFVGRTPNGVPFLPYHTVFASVPDPGNIAPHNDVRINGVRVGQVIKIQGAGDRARVELRLDNDTQLPSDSKVFVRALGLLGARFIELVPGRSTTMVAERGTVTGGADALTYGVPDALNTFDLKTRRRFVQTFDELGKGTLARGSDLNVALGRLPSLQRDGVTISNALLERPGAAANLVPSAASAATAFNSARNGTEGFRPGAQAVQPFVDERFAFDKTLATTPATLDATRSGLATGRRLLASVRTLAGGVQTTLPDAPAALRETTSLLRDNDRALQRTKGLLDEVDPTVPDVLRILASASPALKPAREALTEVLPLVRTAGRHGCDIHSFGQAWHSLLGYAVRGEQQTAELPNGKIGPLHVLRITPVFSGDAIQGVSSNPEALTFPEAYPPACKFANGARYVHDGGPK